MAHVILNRDPHISGIFPRMPEGPLVFESQRVVLCTLRVVLLGVVPKPWNMALNQGIWSPKPSVTKRYGYKKSLRDAPLNPKPYLCFAGVQFCDTSISTGS